MPVELIKSIKLLNQSGIKTKLLSMDPIILWKENEEYKIGKYIIGSIKVVNNTVQHHGRV